VLNADSHMQVGDLSQLRRWFRKPKQFTPDHRKGSRTAPATSTCKGCSYSFTRLRPVSNPLDSSASALFVSRGRYSGTLVTVGSYAITVLMSEKRMKGRWVVYERRNGEFIFLSRLFTTRALAEKERDKLEATFTYKKVSLGVGAIAKK
jgi:hypothetical protein